MYGKLYEKDAMFLRQEVGKLKDDKGNEYELANLISSGSFYIRSKKTGKQFIVSPKDIVEMALEAGIEKNKKYFNIAKNRIEAYEISVF